MVAAAQQVHEDKTPILLEYRQVLSLTWEIMPSLWSHYNVIWSSGSIGSDS